MTGQPPAAPLPTLRQTLARTHRRLIAFAVVLAGAMLLGSGLMIVRDYTARNLALVARTISYTVEPALVFGDGQAVEQGIASVAAINGVRRVEVRDGGGRLVARWAPKNLQLNNRVEDYAVRALRLAPADERILRGRTIVGHVRVYASSQVLARYLLSGLLIALCGLGIAIIATNILARQLEEEVAAPLDRVAEVAHAVRAERAFHLRVPSAGIAEVDRLSHDFNVLLSELQGWHIGMEMERDELERQATHDPLTGLGNRALCERMLAEAVAESVRAGRSMALLMIDADGFKAINDNHGHLAGDATLVAIAERLSASVRRGDTVFRLGGDEFVVLLGPGVGRDQVNRVIDRIHEAMAAPVILPDGTRVPETLSIGAAIYPDDGIAPGDIMQRADEAMYAAKAAARQEKRIHA